MTRRTVLAVVIAGLLATGWGVERWLRAQFVAPGPTPAPLRIEVAPGSSVRGILSQLESSGAIAGARRTELYLRLHGRHPSFKAGAYAIPARASAAQIIALLEQGKVVLETLTVVEGSTFAQLRQALERHPRVSATLRGKTDAEVMAAIGHPGEHPEGRFYPDTYHFAARTTDVEILRMAYEDMQRVLADAWRQRHAGLPIDTPYEALILASIVEKETGLAAERPQIAGVFTNRLRRGMRLQSDPTVIYGIGARYDGDIRSRDLVTDTPYNTYTRAGLPPTPVALPGRESLLAAVQPAETGALFFVATGNGDGSHHFSTTLEEHNRAVKRFLARLKSRSGPEEGKP